MTTLVNRRVVRFNVPTEEHKYCLLGRNNEQSWGGGTLCFPRCPRTTIQSLTRTLRNFWFVLSVVKVQLTGRTELFSRVVCSTRFVLHLIFWFKFLHFVSQHESSLFYIFSICLNFLLLLALVPVCKNSVTINFEKEERGKSGKNSKKHTSKQKILFVGANQTNKDEC